MTRIKSDRDWLRHLGKLGHAVINTMMDMANQAPALVDHPHEAVRIRRESAECLDQYFKAVDIVLEQRIASGIVVITGPELDKKRLPAGG
jgi:hypothetical protein